MCGPGGVVGGCCVPAQAGTHLSVHVAVRAGLGLAVAWDTASCSFRAVFSTSYDLDPARSPLWPQCLRLENGSKNFLSLACLPGSNMMMATNYSNKQNLENHWLTPTISEVLSAAGPQHCCPSEAPAWTHPANMFSWPG